MLQCSDIDATRSLNALHGDVNTYLRLLRQFIKNHHRESQYINNDYQAGNIESAIRRAHTIKGASATLGLLKLHFYAAALEKALQKKEGSIEDLLKKMAEHQNTLFELPLEAKDTSHSIEKIKPEQMRDILDQLGDLLACDDTAADDLFQTHQVQLKLYFADLAEQLKIDIESFDFPKAAEQVNQLRKQLVGE